MDRSSRELWAALPPKVARVEPADTLLPAVTGTLVTSPLVWATTVWRRASSKLPLPAQAMSPTAAVAELAAVRAPGLSTRIFTCRTNAPPLPTRSAEETDSTVPGRVSMVPAMVTWALWPAESRWASAEWKGSTTIRVEVSATSAMGVPGETRSPRWTRTCWTTPEAEARTVRLDARSS